MLDIPRSEQVLRETAFPWDFPRGPVVKTLCFHCRGCGFDPCSGNQDPTCHVAENKNHCSLPALSFYVHLVPQAAELGGILVAVCLIPPSIESSSKFCWFFSQGISFFPFFFFFWPHSVVCRLLAPWLGIEPEPMAVEALTTGLPWNSVQNISWIYPLFSLILP